MKIVLDSNVLLVAIPNRSLYNPVFRAFLEEEFMLCITTDILDEYAEIIGERANKNIAQNTLEAIESAPNVEFVTRYYRWNLIEADHDDDKFVDCAIACGADYIVTNDGHFDVLKNISFPKVVTLTIQEFLDKLQTS
ncbi:putative toxin-antitoxin system toxin component, PIN family [Fibrisoma montanum]|uniref:Putative toxin-antitoxin system toxin component, PIN family n=1 Tax=Fibrisoma montanum TaxID=2305895 RepID=A0A418MEY7_9BACT|nr:putative toxin-antitoxin system toxin component, PIN family [Fibrisoma montanum]RIV25336.1 putative toxin-antitoxin system toxin component, PIN family [Fibrisoma montanum]